MGLSKDPEKRANQLKNLAKGTWRKGHVANPKGRPRKTITSLVQQFEDEGMAMPSPTEVSKLYLYIATRTEEELKAMMSDKEQPMMVRIVAKGILDKKGLDVVEKIVDRAYGKEHRVDITTNGKELRVEPLQIQFVADKEALAKAQAEVTPLEAREGPAGDALAKD